MESINQQPPLPQPPVQNNGEKPSPKYKILGIINIIFGFIQIPIPLGFVFFIIPPLTTFYQSLNIKQPNLTITYSILIFLLTLGLANIFIGIKLVLKSTLNKEKFFKFGIISIIIFFLSIGSSSAFLATSIVSPIYKLTSELDSSPSPTIFQTPSPTPTINISDTSSWKTYEKKFINSDYNELTYEINYPSNWILKEKEDKLLLSLQDEILESKSISIIPHSKFEIKPQVIIAYKKIRTIILNGKNIDILQPVNQTGYVAFINKGNFYLEFIFGSDLDHKYDEIFDQILSTFKFTDVSDSNSLNSNLCEIGKEYVSDNINPNPCQCSDESKRTVVRMTWGVCPTGTNLRDCPASIFKCVE